MYANLAGGLSVAEPALDLPLALALASSSRDRPVRPGTVAIGEVGLLGELRPSSGSNDACARPRGSGSAGDRARIRAAGDPVARIDGLEVVPVATLRDAIAAALAERPSPRGEAVRRDARLTVRRCRSCVRGRRAPSRESSIRYIRVLGAPLGGLVGLALAAIAVMGGSCSTRSEPPALLVAWVVAWIVVGFAILPYLTVVPAQLLVRPRRGSLDRRVRDRRRSVS